jgi:predicted component of type VI protein secretion system
VSLLPTLTVIAGPHEGKTVPLPQQRVIIGRDPSDDVALRRDASVSRHHARISRRAGLLWIEDLDSRNGTFVTLDGGGERRLRSNQPALLLEGTEIRLGPRTRLGITQVQISQDQAVRELLGQLRRYVRSIYLNLPQLDPAAREAECAHLAALEARLETAADETTLLHHVADALSEASLVTAETVVGSGRAVPDGLPPLPEELPEPDTAGRVPSLLNLFITDIRECLNFEEPPDDNNH